jgi:tRNA(Ile)-lysidine synthase
LLFAAVESPGKNSHLEIFVDKDKLTYPLHVRKWREGDYFLPFGMKGKKKLSKYFKDEKLSLVAKEKTWLLCSGDEVVWVIGLRADERFKVEPHTRQIMNIRTSKSTS